LFLKASKTSKTWRDLCYLFF